MLAVARQVVSRRGKNRTVGNWLVWILFREKEAARAASFGTMCRAAAATGVLLTTMFPWSITPATASFNEAGVSPR